MRRYKPKATGVMPVAKERLLKRFLEVGKPNHQYDKGDENGNCVSYSTKTKRE